MGRRWWDWRSWRAAVWVALLVPGWLALGWTSAIRADSAAGDSRGEQVSASSTRSGANLSGPRDGARFSTEAASAWRGEAGRAPWTWEVRFARPRPVGAILQIVGDDAEELRNAPKRSVWQYHDGEHWIDLERTRIDRETRMFRLHRLESSREVHGLRLVIDEAIGESPALREVEFFAEPGAKVEFPDWIAAVSTFDGPDTLRESSGFVTLARQCEGWSGVPAQRVWMGDFDQGFTEAEPRPLCVFLTGNISEWCQKDRGAWRGIAAVLKARGLPIWASCGGAQGLAILEEQGVDRPWDCPRCRDPENPLLPIYTHIGHTGPDVCGSYTRNLAERGPTNLRIEVRDAVLEGLPDQFQSIESHVGQVAYLPRSWVRLVTAGDGAKTINQLFRVDGYPIYGAQFHIEMRGTPETSRRLMSNFLAEAKRWRDHAAPGPAAAPEAEGRP